LSERIGESGKNIGFCVRMESDFKGGMNGGIGNVIGNGIKGNNSSNNLNSIQNGNALQQQAQLQAQSKVSILHAPALERDLPDECPECNSDDIVEDWKQGNLVCRDCGLVVQENLVDIGSEWRTFTNEEPGQDPNRVGGPANPLLESGPTTKIRDERASAGLNRVQRRNAISASDRYLSDAFSRISRIVEHFSVSQRVRDRTQEIFKLYYDHLTLKPDGTRTRQFKEEETEEIIAACFFIGFRNEGNQRTLKEICALTRVVEQKIGARVKNIEKNVEGVKQSNVANTTDSVARFCSRLGLSRDLVNAATYIYEQVREKEGVHGRQPKSIIAASIFIVCQLAPADFQRSAKEIKEVTGVAEVTVRVAYRMIYRHLKSILPPEFEYSQAIATLPVV